MLKQKLPQHKSNRKKDKSEVEHLHGLNRELTKQVAALTRQLKYFEKRDHIYDLSPPDENAVVELPTKKHKLRDCDKDSCGGQYEEYDILEKTIGTCNVCGDRKRIK